ncbi:MAG: thymidine phosphorylase [Patescibacteria group bacterium]
MAFVLRAKRFDLSTGGQPYVVVLRNEDGTNFGIRAGDRLLLQSDGKKIVVQADLTHRRVRPGEIGLFREVWRDNHIGAGEPIMLEPLARPESIEALKKKLLGQRLGEKDILAIVRDIVSNKFGTTELTYFVASSFVREYSNDELYYLTKAIAITGEQIRFGKKVVADKHSVGGVAGNRTTMIVVPILASLGVTIPKTSSRAITSPSGTSDTMEVLAPVTFSMVKIRQIVKKNNACMVWGGGLLLAPADDRIIKVSRPLSLEPYSKMIVSIMAKKVAMGVTHLVIDMPYGPHMKIPDLATATRLAAKFRYLGKRFKINVRVAMIQAREPIGQGVGPALEARDVLRVLQQKEFRPRDLEEKAVKLAGMLIELIGMAGKGIGASIARDQLLSGKAWQRMQGIIRSQGGKPNLDSEDVTLGGKRLRVIARHAGRVTAVNNRAVDELARSLGAPDDKLGGIHLRKRIGDRVIAGEILYTCYGRTTSRLTLAEGALKHLHVYTIARR